MVSYDLETTQYFKPMLCGAIGRAKKITTWAMANEKRDPDKKSKVITPRQRQGPDDPPNDLPDDGPDDPPNDLPEDNPPDNPFDPPNNLPKANNKSQFKNYKYHSPQMSAASGQTVNIMGPADNVTVTDPTSIQT